MRFRVSEKSKRDGRTDGGGGGGGRCNISSPRAYGAAGDKNMFKPMLHIYIYIYTFNCTIHLLNMLNALKCIFNTLHSK